MYIIESEHSNPYNGFMLQLRDTILYFIITTTDDDLISFASGEAEFRYYEFNRLEPFTDRLLASIHRWQICKKLTAAERTLTVPLMQILLSLSKHCKSSLETFADVNADSLRQILGVCYEVLGEISPIRPKIKPFIAEYTDAGPGVGRYVILLNLCSCFICELTDM